jgi:hypothetical protein
MTDVPGGPTPPPPPPPPMMEGPQGAIPPKRLGEILSQALNVYKANAAKLIAIVALVVVPLTLVSTLLTQVARDPDTEGGVVTALLVAVITVAISLIIWSLLEAAIVRAAAQATLGDPIDVEASYRWGFRRIGSVILVSILVGLAVVGGLILLVIPGLIFLVMLSVSIPALIVEDRRGSDALGRSWNLVKGNFWHVVGVIVVAGLITGTISGIIGAIGGNAWFLRWVFSSIGTIVTAPFTALVAVLLYVDLRARGEALTAATLRGEVSRP